MTAGEAEIAETVRRGDPDRYLAALYAPAPKREALLALYAFNVETAAVRDRISEALPGEIRLQWWRDLLAEAADPASAAGHPIAAALLEVVRDYNLPVDAFQNMLEARIFDLYDDPMPSRTDLEGYCGETASALIQLSSLILDAEAAGRTAALAGHAGCAQAIAGLLRLLPIHRRRGQCYIPLDMLQAVGMTQDELVSGEDTEGANRAVVAMIALGRDHLVEFRKGAGDIPPPLRPAFLPVSLAEAYFKRIEQSGLDPLDEIATLSPLRRHWLLLRHATKGW
ncbi:phytoene/squalene synthase family protein [Chelativorans sp. YIM 93263]|uniref:phytoene/squalene synthase family protein n=1 Tax=Chelativorans sp. YIM 93263 TaxID=2906648 RepID=UPI0023783AAC|nr:phytoene/squalene synthase family protein [Chelativorans sp. YIM 93263]